MLLCPQFHSTGTQIQSVWLSALSLSYYSSSYCVSWQTHTVIPVNKYSLSFLVINTVLVKSLKDKTECIWAYNNIKHTIALLEEIFFLHVFLFFLASALRPIIWVGRESGVICLHPQGLKYEWTSYTGTLTDKLYCRAIKRHSGMVKHPLCHLTNSFFTLANISCFY